MIDPASAAAVVSAGAVVVATYLAVRSSIQRSHRERETAAANQRAADAKQRRNEIDEAIKADRDRQELADTKAENAALKDKLRHDDS